MKVLADRYELGDLKMERIYRYSAAIDRTVATLTSEDLAADILVNAAGITRDGVVWKLADAAWDEVMDVNLGGAFRMTRACVPGMRERKRGAIVNVASINAFRGRVGQSNYAASKGGLMAFTHAVATEVARDGIRVNAVAPGFTDTAMTQVLSDEVRAKARDEILLGRFARPDEIASAILFLASPLGALSPGTCSWSTAGRPRSQDARASAIAGSPPTSGRYSRSARRIAR